MSAGLDSTHGAGGESPLRVGYLHVGREHGALGRRQRVVDARHAPRQVLPAEHVGEELRDLSFGAALRPDNYGQPGPATDAV